MAQIFNTGVQPEVLTFSALLTLLGRRSRQSIYDLMRRDPSFPRPRQIGSEFSIGYDQSDSEEVADVSDEPYGRIGFERRW